MTAQLQGQTPGALSANSGPTPLLTPQEPFHFPLSRQPQPGSPTLLRVHHGYRLGLKW